MTCASTYRHASIPVDHAFSESWEPLLTAEQECQLADALALGDSTARDRLVAANLRLVVATARRFAGAGLEFEDLVAEGNLGLITAAQRFDPRHGTRFATYARHWIQQAIRSALTDRSRAIRLPSHVVTLLRRWKRAESGLARQASRGPCFDEVADRLGLSPGRRVLVARALGARTVDDGPTVPSGSRLEDLAGPAAGPGDELERAEASAVLRIRMARRLGERERRLLELRFGLDGGEPLTLRQAGERLGLTREWARKLEARAVAKLRAGHAAA
jgi:RNA polymerase primary sigma factor